MVAQIPFVEHDEVLPAEVSVVELYGPARKHDHNSIGIEEDPADAFSGMGDEDRIAPENGFALGIVHCAPPERGA
jgi:hypothetical protein